MCSVAFQATQRSSPFLSESEKDNESGTEGEYVCV